MSPWLKRCSWHFWTWAWLWLAAALFLVPAFERVGEGYPIPLDDVYIYFGYARSTALGSPLAWQPGHGYSSGATSMLYALALAPLWALGLKGGLLGYGAGILALLFMYDLCRSLRQIMEGHTASWLIAPLLLALPLLNWSLWSGMETALFAAAFGRALRQVHRATDPDPGSRSHVQWMAGLWLALSVLSRPEMVLLALSLSVAVAYGSRSRRALPALLRSGGPLLAALLAQALLNRSLTGEWLAAGALRKLITSDPSLDGAERTLFVLRNLLVLGHQAFYRACGGLVGTAALTALVLATLVRHRYRVVAIATLMGSLGGLWLICLNRTARFQNYRYAAPLLLVLLCLGSLGCHALACYLGPRLRGRWLNATTLPALLVGVLLVAAGKELSLQTEHFAQASQNIAQQQVEVARRLKARSPRPRRVLVGDAGAIPYLSGLSTIDGLGLGGFHGLPFARASVQGIPAVVELIGRLESAQRPDVMALYPSWWHGLADVFGRRVDGVRIERNVICAAAEKVIYEADWSTLAPPRERPANLVDQLNVVDLVAERGHAYEVQSDAGDAVHAPLVAATLRDAEGRRRYDGGRIIQAGQREVFVLRPDGAAAMRFSLTVRTDATPCRLEVRLDRGPAPDFVRELEFGAPAAGRWAETSIELPPLSGDGYRLQIRPLSASFHSFRYRLRELPQTPSAVVQKASR